jgi:hypothetical protein
MLMRGWSENQNPQRNRVQRTPRGTATARKEKGRPNRPAAMPNATSVRTNLRHRSMETTTGNKVLEGNTTQQVYIMFIEGHMKMPYRGVSSPNHGSNAAAQQEVQTTILPCLNEKSVRRWSCANVPQVRQRFSCRYASR